MGNSSSSSSHESENGVPRKKAAPPVLIPPSFVATPPEKMPLTLQAKDALNRSFWPEFFRNVLITDPSHRLVTDFFQPGLWVQSLTSRSKVGASLQFSKDDISIKSDQVDNSTTKGDETKSSSASTTTSSTSKKVKKRALTGGTILGERHLSNTVSAQIRSGTQMGPCLSANLQLFPGFNLRGAANNDGQAWVSGIGSYNTSMTLQQQRLPLSMVSAAWMPLDFSSASPVGRALGDRETNKSPLVPHITAFGACRVAGMTAAVQSQCSTETWQFLRNRYYWTVNFTDDERGPPLQITFHQHDDNVQTLALSQFVSFDRYQVNPIEDRADFVRNTVGWTVQLQSSPSPVTIDSNSETATKTSSNNDDAKTITTATMAGAWQVNRAVALKAIVQPQEQCIDLAVILKRWRHPRITCSFLTRHDWSNHTTRFLGLGLELETGSVDGISSRNEESAGAYYQDEPVPHGSNKAFPETRVV